MFYVLLLGNYSKQSSLKLVTFFFSLKFLSTYLLCLFFRKNVNIKLWLENLQEKWQYIETVILTGNQNRG